MFGFFKTKCPFDARGKAWIELRFRWLTEQLGLERMLSTEVVLPSDQMFADLDDSVESMDRLAERVCHRMELNVHELRFELCPDEDMDDAAGTYELLEENSAVVRVAESRMRDASSLVATLVHELSHHVLLGGKLIDAEETDHEFVTDLLSVYMGFGIFSANSVMRENYVTDGQWSSWSMGKQGYLNALDFGYAMALFAWLRDEHAPGWSKCLRLDAAESFATGATYLRKTGDSICTRDRTTPFPDRTIQQLIADVSGGTDSERVASIWELRARDGVSECVPTLVNQLQHKNPIIRTEALTSLGWLREAALPVVDDLIACTEDRSAEVRGAAAHALGRIGDEPDHVIPYLADLLKDHERSVVTSAVAGLAEYGVLATPASKAIFGVLRQALVRCDYPLADLALAIVTNITKDPLAELEEYFADDEDLRYQVVDQLNALATGEDS